jgi:hypothetical protein
MIANAALLNGWHRSGAAEVLISWLEDRRSPSQALELID